MAQDRLGSLMALMLGCAERHLSRPVGLATVVPGNAVVWDDCCNGQLWTRIISIAGASTSLKASGSPCLPLYQVRVGMGVIRCAFTVDEQGVPPSAAQMTADAFQTYQDLTDLVEAINCCIRPTEAIETLRIGDWSPLGPNGGCVGGELTLTFNHALCTPCEEAA